LSALEPTGIPVVGWAAVPGADAAGGQNYFSSTGDIASHNSDAWNIVLTSRGITKLALVTGSLEAPDLSLLQSLAPSDGASVVYYNAGLPQVVTAPQALSVAQAIQASGATGVVIFGCTDCQTIPIDLNQLGDPGVKVIQTSVFGPQVIKQFGKSVDGMLYSGRHGKPVRDARPGCHGVPQRDGQVRRRQRGVLALPGSCSTPMSRCSSTA